MAENTLAYEAKSTNPVYVDPAVDALVKNRDCFAVDLFVDSEDRGINAACEFRWQPVSTSPQPISGRPASMGFSVSSALNLDQRVIKFLTLFIVEILALFKSYISASSLSETVSRSELSSSS